MRQARAIEGLRSIAPIRSAVPVCTRFAPLLLPFVRRRPPGILPLHTRFPAVTTVPPQENTDVPRRWILSIAAVIGTATPAFAQATARLNPLVDLLEGGRPVFGVYVPANRRPPRVSDGDAPTATPREKSPAELAREAVSYTAADYLFDGSMEGDFERGLASFSAFVAGMGTGERGSLRAGHAARLQHPLVVKTSEVAPDPVQAARRIGRQLGLGVSAIVLVDVRSAEEAREGIAAMRFRSNGGTRAEDAGEAPARWGMSAAEYRERADVWPLAPRGELLAWAIVESREGLSRVREIAAVSGISVLLPGAGTLRGVFTSTKADGTRVFDEAGWEEAIQQVLAACKEFKVACGYPANVDDIELRMRQGFSVFVIGWGEQGFRAVEVGRRAAGRTASSDTR